MNLKDMTLRLLAAGPRYADDLRGELELGDDKRELAEVLRPLLDQGLVSLGEHDGLGRPINLTKRGRETVSQHAH